MKYSQVRCENGTGYSVKDAIEKRFKVPFQKSACRDIKGENKSGIAVFSCTKQAFFIKPGIHCSWLVKPRATKYDAVNLHPLASIRRCDWKLEGIV